MHTNKSIWFWSNHLQNMHNAQMMIEEKNSTESNGILYATRANYRHNLRAVKTFKIYCQLIGFVIQFGMDSREFALVHFMYYLYGTIMVGKN